MKKIKEKIQRLKGERDGIRKQLRVEQNALETNTEHSKNLEQARVIISEVSLQTQKSLQYHISDITSLALEAVFDEPYRLDVNFVERRNKTECDLMFEKDGEMVEPLEASGYGAVDVAAFALRAASWSMMRPRPAPVILMDEPMRFLDSERQVYASKMIKEISSRLGIQFIIVTHEDSLADASDGIFKVKQRRIKGWEISKVIKHEQ